MMGLSIVVPIFNEQENVLDLHKEIKEVCIKNKYNYEIIFIDDGSTDNTGMICKSLSPLKYIRLRKNFGQTAAFDAGIKKSKYDFILTMDGDRQNDPSDIPILIKHLEENDYDIVSGWRKRRKDNFFKKFISRGANFLRKILINDGIHDSGCALKIYKKECFEKVTLYGEMHRFIPALLKIKGFKVGEIVVNHRKRIAGVTKYNWKRTIKGFIDMISVWFWNKYAVRPLHLLGGIGFLFLLVGGVSSIYTVYYYFSTGKVGHTAWPITSIFFILMGIQMFISGLIADMLSRTYHETINDYGYNIKEIKEN